jgi:hypothetical protein
VIPLLLPLLEIIRPVREDHPEEEEEEENAVEAPPPEAQLMDAVVVDEEEPAATTADGRCIDCSWGRWSKVSAAFSQFGEIHSQQQAPRPV